MAEEYSYFNKDGIEKRVSSSEIHHQLLIPDVSDIEGGIDENLLGEAEECYELSDEADDVLEDIEPNQEIVDEIPEKDARIERSQSGMRAITPFV